MGAGAAYPCRDRFDIHCMCSCTKYRYSNSCSLKIKLLYIVKAKAWNINIICRDRDYCDTSQYKFKAYPVRAFGRARLN